MDVGQNMRAVLADEPLGFDRYLNTVQTIRSYNEYYKLWSESLSAASYWAHEGQFLRNDGARRRAYREYLLTYSNIVLCSCSELEDILPLIVQPSGPEDEENTGQNNTSLHSLVTNSTLSDTLNTNTLSNLEELIAERNRLIHEPAGQLAPPPLDPCEVETRIDEWYYALSEVVRAGTGVSLCEVRCRWDRLEVVTPREFLTSEWVFPDDFDDRVSSIGTLSLFKSYTEFHNRCVYWYRYLGNGLDRWEREAKYIFEDELIKRGMTVPDEFDNSELIVTNPAGFPERQIAPCEDEKYAEPVNEYRRKIR